METELHCLSVQHRAKGRKISVNCMRMTTKKTLKVSQTDKVGIFEASIGWFERFIKRKKIKFCKSKSGKKYNGESNVIKTDKASLTHKNVKTALNLIVSINFIPLSFIKF